MRYLSLFSGIEAASVAWHGLGWSPVAFAEVEPFPSAVLAERFPTVPNWGDVTKFKEWPNETVNLIVGGSPCQSFSVAGLRKGLDDPRGNLALTYLAIVEKYQPEWVVWENVPGVLSSNGGRDFATFLGALAQLGYGFAYRVLDAQFTRTPDYPRAVPQRRRRVFVVGNLRDWRRAAAVLFDGESLCGNPPPSREKRQGSAAYASSSFGGYGERPGCFQASGGDLGGGSEHLTVTHAFKIRGGSETETGEQGGTPGKKAGKGYLGKDEVAFTVASTQDQHIAVSQQDIAGTLDASYYKGCGAFQGREQEIVAVAYETNPTDARCSEIKDGVGPTVKARWGTGGNNQALVQQVGAFYGGLRTDGTTGTLRRETKGHEPSIITSVDWRTAKVDEDITQTLKTDLAKMSGPCISQQSMAVRRLTPKECERLQGFPDDWTRIPWRKKTAEDCPDGPRYKAIGNSMAVNVMQWIGIRLAMVNEIVDNEETK